MGVISSDQYFFRVLSALYRLQSNRLNKARLHASWNGGKEWQMMRVW